MTDLEPDSKTDYKREIRSLIRPFLIFFALTALLVVMLALVLSWTTRQIQIADALRMSPHPELVQQRRTMLVDASRNLLFVTVPAIIALLAFGAYRAHATVQKLRELFARQIDLQLDELAILRRRHFLLSAAMSGVGDAVIAADVKGRITFLNPIAEKLTDWEERDAIGRDVKSVLTLIDERTGLMLADPAGAILSSSLRLDFPLHVAQVALGGDHHPVSGSGTPIWEEEGKLGGVALVFRDISERRAADETLRDMAIQRVSSEARAAAMLESALDCVVLVRQGGEIAGFNPAAERTFGWTSIQVLGRTASDLLFPASVRARIQLETLSSLPSHVEIQAVRADGREFLAEMTITQILHQEAPLFAIHLRDISERHNAEEALRQAQDDALAAALSESRAKSVFLNDMSDELRTPLNAVIGYSEMLQEDAIDRDQGDLIPDLQKIHGAGKHLLSLINDILDLSKIEAGQMEFYPETFDVATLLDEVTKTVQPIITQHESTLQVRAESSLGVLYADRVKVKQSLVNVISNAAGFSNGRTVALEASREQSQKGNWVTFRLADASANQDLPLYHQLHEADPVLETSGLPQVGGQGLALVIARRFCQLQGGEFTGSREPGHAAVYQLRFPAQ